MRVFANARMEDQWTAATRAARVSGRVKRRLQAGVQWGLKWMSYGEQQNAVELYRAFRAAGMAEAPAVAKVADYTRRTQNPSSPAEETIFYRSTRDNPLIRSVLPFLGQPTVMTNFLAEAILSLRAARVAGDAAAVSAAVRSVGIRLAGAGVMAALSAAIVALARAVRTRGDDDDGDDKRYRDYANALQEFADYVLPGVGRIADNVPVTLRRSSESGELELAWDDYSITRNQALVARDVQRAFSGVRQMWRGVSESDAERALAAAVRLAQGAGGLMGIPVEPVSQIAEYATGRRLGVLPAAQPAASRSARPSAARRRRVPLPARSR
jgi:uncharacterized protein YoaH (UPF0181 family)